MLEVSWYGAPADFAEVTEELKRSHRDLVAVVSTLPTHQWDSSPPDGGWSASQIVEHIAIAQGILREQVWLHLQDDPRPEWPPGLAEDFSHHGDGTAESAELGSRTWAP